MAANQNIELEIREPTGLGLGTFDLFVVRQKIYEGELTPTCQFKTTRGEWVALAERADFANIFWLLGESVEDPRVQKRPTFGGWKAGPAENSKSEASAETTQDPQGPRSQGGLKGLAGRLRRGKGPKPSPEAGDK